MSLFDVVVYAIKKENDKLSKEKSIKIKL